LDLNLSPAEEAFRQEVRSWIRENLPPEWKRPRFEIFPPDDEAAVIFRKWQEKLGAGGWLGLSWPTECGGRGASMVEQAIFKAEAAEAGAPPPLDTLGQNMVGPALIELGSAEQKQRFLRPILRGEMVWCQGFSEPNAGSDLASLNTKAVLDGDHWVVNGQKVWSSYGPWADWCAVLTRTNPDVPKHKGISMLTVDMKTPGVTMRRIAQINGKSEFAEIFFDNVRVPRDNVIGEVDNGWAVAMRLLTYERGLYTLTELPRYLSAWKEARDYARTHQRNGRPLIEDPIVAEKLAQAYFDIHIMRLTNLRYISRYMRGAAPGEESSLMKLHWAVADQHVYDLAMALAAPASLAMRNSPRLLFDGSWNADYFYSRTITIYGGTQDIHCNLIAERIYGLPR
jgi:alkylation response protein AidB-like acyl-CoA dehydrogenase